MKLYKQLRLWKSLKQGGGWEWTCGPSASDLLQCPKHSLSRRFLPFVKRLLHTLVLSPGSSAQEEQQPKFSHSSNRLHDNLLLCSELFILRRSQSIEANEICEHILVRKRKVRNRFCSIRPFILIRSPLHFQREMKL